jgi:hypothetical protein
LPVLERSCSVDNSPSPEEEGDSCAATGVIGEPEQQPRNEARTTRASRRLGVPASEAETVRPRPSGPSGPPCTGPPASPADAPKGEVEGRDEHVRPWPPLR